MGSSEDELEFVEEQYEVFLLVERLTYSLLIGQDNSSQIPNLRTPLQTLSGHSGVVISGDWLCGGDQVITGRLLIG